MLKPQKKQDQLQTLHGELESMKMKKFKGVLEYITYVVISSHFTYFIHTF